MLSTNLDQFQLIVCALVLTACWAVEKGREKKEQSAVWIMAEKCQREEEFGPAVQSLFRICWNQTMKQPAHRYADYIWRSFYLQLQ